jgi:hypothetical protein
MAWQRKVMHGQARQTNEQSQQLPMRAARLDSGVIETLSAHCGAIHGDARHRNALHRRSSAQQRQLRLTVRFSEPFREPKGSVGAPRCVVMQGAAQHGKAK